MRLYWTRSVGPPIQDTRHPVLRLRVRFPISMCKTLEVKSSPDTVVYTFPSLSLNELTGQRNPETSMFEQYGNPSIKEPGTSVPTGKRDCRGIL